MFLRIIQQEIKKIYTRREFNIVFTANIIVILTLFVISCRTIINRNTSELMSAYQLWIGYDTSEFNFIKAIYYLFFLTMPASIAFSDSYLEEKRGNALDYIILRFNKNLYIFAKGIMVFVSGFIIVFLPLLLHQLMCIVAVPLYTISETALGGPAYDRYYLTQLLFADLHVISPYLHNILYMIIDGIFGGSIALLSYSLSFMKYVNRYIVIIFPTVAFYMENFISQFLGRPDRSIIFYLYPTTGIRGMDFRFFIYTILFIIGACTITICINGLKKE